MTKEKIKILFDSQIFDIQRVGGISRLYGDLASSLNEAEGFSADFSVNSTNNEYIKDIIEPKSSKSNILESIDRLKESDFDIFYPTFFSPYFLKYIGTKPFVMSVHDMIPNIYEDLFKKNDLQIIGKKIMCEKAAAIEVPTECTKRDLIKFFQVDEKKIHVIGRTLNSNFGEEFGDKSIFDFDYILFVGARGGYKRFNWFVKHISDFMAKHKDIHLVCTSSNFNESEKKLLNEYDLLDRCHAMYVNDFDLATLYKYAKFFVFPSEYEGFGLPILESYKMDCIALLNYNDVFKEVTDDKGIYFTLSENKSNLSEVAEYVFSLDEEKKKEVLKQQHNILKKYSREKYLDKYYSLFIKAKMEFENQKKIAVCCIGRMENRYIEEYVEYYNNIGVDKIFLYDNNYDGEERFEDVIGNYINNGFVELIDYRNQSKCQLKVYQDCYDKHGKEYDWILFIDCGDEYLYMNGFNNIKDFLSQEKFNGFDIIHINIMNYGDNNIVRYSNEKLCERFVNPIIPLDFKKSYDFPENDHISSIVRGGLNTVIWEGTPHTPVNYLRCCDASGNKQESTSPFIHPFDFSCAHFKHYTTKTIEEWYEIKSKRGYPDGNKDYFKTHDVFEEFFKWNEKTSEKIEYIDSLNINNLDNLDIFICTHKDFTPPVKNNVYKVINCNDINNDTWNGLNGSFYSEIMTYFYVAENYQLKDYVGFCHYRKYWSFMDDIPNVSEIISNNEVIVATPIKFKMNIKNQYAEYHNIEDLYIVSGILSEIYPNYINAWNAFLDGSLIFPYNMFIMKKEEFLKYIEFMRNILDRFVEVIGKNIEKRITNNKDKYFKDFSPNNEMWYQYRIGGYLAERLTNAWLINNHKLISVNKVIIIEEKYK